LIFFIYFNYQPTIFSIFILFELFFIVSFTGGQCLAKDICFDRFFIFVFGCIGGYFAGSSVGLVDG
jgi:hypothetical protein